MILSKSTSIRSLLLILIAVFFFLGFNARAEASPGRTIVIHNNTEATLTLAFRGRNWTIPPHSKRSFFNILLPGRNELSVTAVCVNGSPHKRFTVWVSGEMQRRREFNFFSKHFGKTVMFDRPGCGTANPAACKRIVGRWHWFTGRDVDFFENNRWKTVDGRDSGGWRCLRDGRFVVTPDRGGWQDTVTVHPNGTQLSGRNRRGQLVKATKDSPKKPKCPGGYNPYGC